MYIRPANWRCENVELFKWYQLGRVWGRAMVKSAQKSALCIGQVGVNLFHWVSNVYAESFNAMLGIKAPGCVVVTRNCWVSSYRSLQRFMPMIPDTPLLIFPDLSEWFLNAIFHFLYCGMWKDFLTHYGHIQWEAHVRLIQLSPTVVPCHSSRHVENLQNINCCV
jgi:hypothetical protein